MYVYVTKIFYDKFSLFLKRNADCNKNFFQYNLPQKTLFKYFMFLIPS